MPTSAPWPGGRGLGGLAAGRDVPGQPGPVVDAGAPALVLYALAVAWAAVVAAVALTGPWQRDPLGPPGVIAAVTLGVIGLGLMTGSRLAVIHLPRVSGSAGSGSGAARLSPGPPGYR